MRIRTTNSIFGFSLGGTLGDEYENELTVSYRTDDTQIKMNAFPF